MSGTRLPAISHAPWVRRRLLSWFDRHRRDLPWRRDRDPYRIWVSEVMLQQTQVATVIPFFERFLKAFPTVADLAAAGEHDVLRLWEGLGYYRRARDLHRAARRLVAEAGGRLPDDPDLLHDLPGMGRYTVGAILSQAFERRLPILEANSQRVLSRFFGRRDDPRQGAARQWLWQAAETLLPRRRVGDFNQALMELGALVCTSGTPRCEACPLAAHCTARQLGLQDEIPPRARAPRIVLVQEAAIVVHRANEVLLVQRPGVGRWAEMWEFPHGVLETGETPEDGARRILTELAGVRVELGPELMTLHHGVTHHRITMVCFEGRYRSGQFRSSFYQKGAWLRLHQVRGYPVSVPQRRLIQVLTGKRTESTS